MRSFGLLAAFALLPMTAACSAVSSGARGGRKWVEGRQGRLRVDDGGSGGIPVLLVHGNGGNRSQWAGQLEHLRGSRRAAAFDLRGMGESELAGNGDYSVEGFAEDVAAVADALGFQRFVLVGHSYGGAVVAAYAGKHPDRLAGLVFADVAGDIRNPTPVQAETLRSGLLPEHYEEFTRRWFEAILVKGSDGTKDAVFRSLRAPAPRSSSPRPPACTSSTRWGRLPLIADRACTSLPSWPTTL